MILNETHGNLNGKDIFSVPVVLEKKNLNNVGEKNGLCISDVNRSFNNFAFPKHDSLRAGLTDSNERFYIRSGRPLVTGFY